MLNSFSKHILFTKKGGLPKDISWFFPRVFLVVFLLIFSSSFAQEKREQPIDSLIQNKYGLRVGIDLYNPIYTVFDNKRKGLELIGDYRITRKIYLAAEFGYLENKTEEDFIHFTSNGSYFKAGINYNAYKNWLDMENEIYVGIRYGISTFSQTLHSYTINNDAILDNSPAIKDGAKFENLNAHWAEFVVGIKAETLNNLFLGFSINGKKMIRSKEPDNFKNLFIPGFNRVFLNNAGFGFNYTISYLIPLYKKDK